MIQQHNDPVQKICDLISAQDTFKLNADVDELTQRYKPMVRDVLIVVTNPDTPEQLVNAMSDELQFQTRELLDRLNANLHVAASYRSGVCQSMGLEAWGSRE